MSVEVDGAQLVDGLRGKQVPLLLAYLVLNRSRHVGRDELIDALWPYGAPRSQDAALRTLLSRLRSALGGSRLMGRDELILQLPEPVWIDLEAAGVELQRGVQALQAANPRGAWALAQVPLNIATRGLLPGSQAPWLERYRRDLEDIRLQALEMIGRAGLQLGGAQLASAERAARNLIESEPYRESGYALLMEAKALQGNVAEGLRVFERLRTLLREELGTSPSAETIALHDRLLQPGSGAGSFSREAGQAEARIELPAELRASADAPLVGRRDELGQLQSAWLQRVEGHDSVESSGRLVLLVGEPGIGKTRLAAELASRAYAEGAVVLAGRATAETLAPYQPFLEALRHYLLDAPLSEVRANAHDYGSELARLVPELRRRAPELSPPVTADPETERYRLFEAVVGLLRSVSAATPILLVFDDLHWADRPTLLLLRHLARAADPAHLLILGAYRASEAAALDGFGGALAELRRERLVSQLQIGGLGEHETAELVRIRTGEAPRSAFARALHDQTEGNPFFIEEMVRHLAHAGVQLSTAGPRELQRFGLPEGVTEMIARRLRLLDERSVEWLRVASVIGRDFDASVLEQVVALDEDEFLNALDEAIASGLVVEAAEPTGRYSFSHALVRETLYDGMSEPRRARIHLRVGEALEGAQAGRVRYIPLLAHHFTRAGRPEEADKAIDYARQAGEQATEMLAHEEAAQHYARALEVLERFYPDALERRCQLLLALGEARVRSGERALTWPAFHEAAALAERLGDAESLGRAAIGASRRYVQEPGVVDAELIAMLERALEFNRAHTLLRVQLLARLCGALYYSPQRSRMEGLSEEASAIARALGDPEARAYACAARRRALWDAAHLQERLKTSAEMLTLAKRIGNLELQLQAHAWLVVDLLEQGDRDAVDAQIEVFSAGAERLRQPLYLWNALVWGAMRALLAGNLDEADALAADALAAGSQAEAVTAPQYYAIQLLAIRREQDRMAELEPAMRRMVDGNPALPAWRAALAALLCAAGQSVEAASELEQLASSDFQDLADDGDWMTTMTLLSDVCTSLKDGARAGLLYERLLPCARANVVIGVAAVCLGSAERYLGRLAATTGREKQAAQHFERALEINAALKAPVCLAHTQLDYAELLEAGDRQQKLVAAAAATAERLELPWVAQRAADFAQRAAELA